MQLYDNWKEILQKAWSIRFIVLAGILSGIEVILPFFADSMPRGVFSLLSFFAVAGAFISRIVAQKNV